MTSDRKPHIAPRYDCPPASVYVMPPGETTASCRIVCPPAQLRAAFGVAKSIWEHETPEPSNQRDRDELDKWITREDDMTEDNLIHRDAIAEVIARLANMTGEAWHRDPDASIEEIMQSHFENLGICPDGLIDVAQAWTDLVLSNPNAFARAMMSPDTIMAAGIARAISVGVVLGRENPR